MIVTGKLDSILFLMQEATSVKITGKSTRRTLKAGRRLGLNESELGSVLKALEMEGWTEWNEERSEWQIKHGKETK